MQNRPRSVATLHPVTFALLAFAFLNFAGATLAVALLSPQDLRESSAANAVNTIRFSRGHTADDSWKAMQVALDEFRSNPRGNVYQRVFFERRIKFQYPPSSLLALDLFGSLTGQPPSVTMLNRIGWLFVLALALLTPAIYFRAMRDFNPGLWRAFRRRDLVLQAAVVTLMTLTFYPLTHGFVIGQIQTWLTGLFAGAVLAWLCGREALSGVLVGLIVAVKPQLGLLLVWGALRRRGRFVAAAAATILVIGAASLWRYGLQNHTGYLAVLSYMSAHGESFYPNQSVNGLLARILHIGNNLDWVGDNFPPYHWFVYCGTLASSAALVALALVWGRKQTSSRKTAVGFVMAALLFTMASPIAWEHHFGILVAGYAVLLPRVLKEHASSRGLVWLAASYFLVSNSFPFANRTADTPWNFVQSYLFAGAVLLIFAVHLRARGIRDGASRLPAESWAARA